MRLSPRQRQALTLVCEGNTDKEIASQLDLSVRTVTHHVNMAVKRLNAKSRSHAAAIFVSRNLAGIACSRRLRRSVSD